MNEMNSAVERLEARLECQAARIDALYALLEERGVATDRRSPIEKAPRIRPRSRGPRRRPHSRIHLGTATGV
jgi:hypothetical protein